MFQHFFKNWEKHKATNDFVLSYPVEFLDGEPKLWKSYKGKVVRKNSGLPPGFEPLDKPKGLVLELLFVFYPQVHSLHLRINMG